MRNKKPLILPIGLDLGHDSVKLLQLELRDGRLAVRAAARQGLDPALWEKANSTEDDRRRAVAAAAAAVRALVRGEGFSGRAVVASVPRELLHIKNVRIPITIGGDVAAAVAAEAKATLAFDVDQAKVRYLSAGQVRQGNDVRQEVIALAAKSDDLDGFLEQLAPARVRVESLDAEPCALFRGWAFFAPPDEREELQVLVEVGLRRTQVVIGRENMISFIKTIETGGLALHAAVSRKLGISLEEARALRRRVAEELSERSPRDSVRRAVIDAGRSTLADLARDVSLCLRYHAVTFRGQRPHRVRLLGGEAFDPQLQAALSAALALPVQVGRISAELDTSTMSPADLRGGLSDWAVALGLALKRLPKPSESTSRKVRTHQASAIDLRRILPAFVAAAGAAPTKPREGLIVSGAADAKGGASAEQSEGKP